jgi:hypothetical protein
LPASDRRQVIGCGCSSVVEHDLAKVGVEGSNPFARSNYRNISSGFQDGQRACPLAPFDEYSSEVAALPYFHPHSCAPKEE